MAVARTCPTCGRQIKGRGLDGLCPECLLNEGLTPEPQNPASDAPEFPRPATPLKQANSRLGDYELLEMIAHGGMGMVYKARQVSLDRVVALKVLLFGSHASSTAIHRFRAEAVAAASLHHPNIVAIHEVGFCEGQHFLAMDYVEGRPLSALLAGKPLPPRRAAGYLRTIAEAVHHAHEHGILHRDLKPSNVLIDREDQPRITDFGLAKRLESDSDLTVSGQVLGSPNYMSPEQASGKRGALTRRSDIYSLGAMLYELLTGRPPFVGEGLAQIVPQVLNTEPLAPRTLNPSVPLDLQTVCLKCLEKQPEKRYPTALALAEDLGRFLESKPVLARPVGRLGKTCRWCRRQPVRAALAAGLLLALVLGSAGVLWQWRRAEQQRLTAQTNDLRTRQHAYAADISRAQRAIEANDLELAISLLDTYRATNRAASNSGLAYPDLRHWEWRYLRQLCLSEESSTLCRYPTWVNSPQVSSDGKYLAFRKGLGEVAVWDLASRQGLEELPAPALIRAKNLVFIPGTALLIVGTVGPESQPQVMIWDANLGQEKERFAVSNPVQALAISPDGKWLAILHVQGEVTILDLAAKQPCAEFAVTSAVSRQERLMFFSPESALCFSRDGKRLVVGRFDGRVEVLEWRTGSTFVEIPSQDPYNGVIALACSPVEDVFAWSSGYGSSLIWLGNFAGGKPLGEPLRGHTDWVAALAFSPDGQWLASAGVDRTIRLWSVAQRSEVRRFQGHLDEVWGLAFLPNGKTLVSGGKGGSVRLWNITETNQTPGQINLPVRVRGGGCAWASGGQDLITVDWDRSVRLWRLHPFQELERLDFLGTNILSLGSSDDGSRLVAADDTGKLGVWDWNTRRVITNLVLPRADAYGLMFSARSKYFFAVVERNTAAFWNTLGWETASWTPIPRMPDLARLGISAANLSPNERVLVTGHTNGTVKLLAFPSNEPLAEYSGHSGMVIGLTFSPDGRTIASAASDGYVSLYDVAGRRLVAHFRAQTQSVRGLCYSPDGRRLATFGTLNDPAKVWDLATLRPLITLPANGRLYFAAAFSPDGNILLGADAYGMFGIWRAPSFSQLEPDERAKSRRPAINGPRSPEVLQRL